MGVKTIQRTLDSRATPAMRDDSPLTFSLPAVSRKKVTAAFDGGRLSSDSGVILLSLAERRRAIARAFAALIDDPRDPAHITHTVEDVLRARMLAIACGYPDGNDFHFLRSDPAFKLACGRLPDTGADLCSQATVSRWENAPTLKEIVRLTYALIDIWCASYRRDLERRLGCLLAVEPDTEAGLKLRRGIEKCRDKLFVFVTRRDVPPTNNVSERRLRPSVIFRKVTNGFRCEWGAETYAAFRSVVSTAKANHASPLGVLRCVLAAKLPVESLAKAG